MGRLARQFSADDLRAISLAIAAAEKRSGCEIVPVLAFESGRYDRGEDVFGLLCAIALLCMGWLGLSMGGAAEATGLWQEGGMPPLFLWQIIAVLVGGFVGGAFLATKIPGLKTLFVAQQEMREEVARAAQACFYNQGIRRAPNAAGVLLYVSHYERMVQIVGDDAAQAKINTDEWQAICDLLRDGMKKGNPTFGFVSAINKTGFVLDGAFVGRAEDGQGFADALVILE